MANFPKNNDGGGGGENLPTLPNGGAKEISEPRCKVCTSVHRRDIDRYLVMGMSCAEIARYYEAIGEMFTRKSVWTHSKKHLTLHNKAIRNIIEKKAEEALMDVEDTTDLLLTKRAILDIMLQKGYESVLSGISVVEPKDLISVIDKIDKMETEEQSIAVDEMVRDFKAFADAVKTFVSEDSWIQIYERYEQNLKMDKLQPKALRAGSDLPEDVEIIDEE